MSSYLARSSERRKVRPGSGNSRSRNGNDLPRQRLASNEVAKAQGEVLQGVFGRLKSPAKEMGRATGMSERACRNQLAGLNSMQLAEFFNACQTIPELQDWGLMMMGIPPTDPRFMPELTRGRQAITILLDDGRLSLGTGPVDGN